MTNTIPQQNVDNAAASLSFNQEQTIYSAKARLYEIRRLARLAEYLACQQPDADQENFENIIALQNAMILLAGDGLKVLSNFLGKPE